MGIVGKICPPDQAWSRSEAQNYQEDNTIPYTAAETVNTNVGNKHWANNTAKYSNKDSLR